MPCGSGVSADGLRVLGDWTLAPAPCALLLVAGARLGARGGATAPTRSALESAAECELSRRVRHTGDCALLASGGA
jgi:hypothetical protein